MNFKSICSFIGLVICVVFFGLQSCSNPSELTISENAKLALRDVGHHLLLANQDSTSLVKPIVTLSDFKYQLAVENELIIHPDSLVAIVKNSFNKVALPEQYLVEVLQCQNLQVAYSYQMNKNVEKNIIPCGGRELHNGCYVIQVRFIKTTQQNISNSYFLGLLVLVSLGLIILFIYKQKKSKIVSTAKQEDEGINIGQFAFYPQQNKLIKEAKEITLSKKECELLAIFVANINQVVKREELTKKVWEDNGVFVGRSLDTYISKLRKKLKDDDSISFTNVHGVGYKLSILV